MKNKLVPVRSIAELRSRAKNDDRYRKLAVLTANNLGVEIDVVEPIKDYAFNKAIESLRIAALETDEEAVVEEINFCIADV